jgi:hypothetical protein
MAVKRIEMSQKHEFLIVSGSNGVELYDPANLKLIFNTPTDYPVNQAIISNKIYSKENQKFHLLMACGYDAMQ